MRGRDDNDGEVCFVLRKRALDVGVTFFRRQLQMLLRVLEIFGAQVNGGGGNCFAEFGEPWQKLTDPPTAPTACADLDVTKWFVHRRIVVAALHRSAATPTRENLSATV